MNTADASPLSLNACIYYKQSKRKLLEPTFPMSFQSMMLAFQLISLQHWYLI
jgi:hypothetical protein